MNRSSWSSSKEGRIQLGERSPADVPRRDLAVPKAALEDGILHLLATAAEMQQRQDLESARQLYEAAIAKMKTHSLDRKKFLTGTAKKPPPLNSRTPIDWCLHVGDMSSAIVLLGNPDVVLTQLRTRMSLDNVEELLKAGANIEYRVGPIGRTLLLRETSEGNYKGVRLALDYGASITCMDDAGDTALTLAVRSGEPGSLDIITDLLHLGADIDARDGKGDSILKAALINAQPDVITKIMELLSPLRDEHMLQIQNYASSISCSQKGISPRTLAVLNLLLRYGLDPNTKCQDKSMDNLFELSMRQRGEESRVLVEALLEHGAEPNFELALRYADSHILELILTKLIPLTESQKSQMATWVNSLSNQPKRWTTPAVDVLKLLLDFGLDPNFRREKAPHSPLIVCAADLGHLSLVEKLIAHKANLTASNDDSDTALVCAAKNKNRPVYDAIKAGGANDKYFLGWTVWSSHANG